MRTVDHITITKGISANALVLGMKNSGVMGAGRIAKAADVLTAMLNDKECTLFLGQAGAMVPGGMKEILIDLLRTKRFSAFVTTGATLTHDLVEALGFRHYQGTAHCSDEELNKKGLDRMYDSLMPNQVYEELEKFFKKQWDILSTAKNIPELLSLLGSVVENKQSLLRTCHDCKIPIFCPALADSGIGLMIWGRLAEGKKLNIFAFDDLDQMIKLTWGSKKNGVLYIGGGTPKNYIQQALQFGNKASYGVQITTDMPQWGGSSGAELREGISWGKMNPQAEFVDVYCDATIALPLIWAAVKERVA